MPACWKDAFLTGGSPAPSGAASPAASSPAASTAPGQGTVLTLTAENIRYDKVTLQAPASQPFQITFTNNDAGTPHNVEILRDGISVWKGEIFSGVDMRTYDVPALAAGSYTFVCSVHPSMKGTLEVK